jgi:hypothetical protein
MMKFFIIWSQTQLLKYNIKLSSYQSSVSGVQDFQMEVNFHICNIEL